MPSPIEAKFQEIDNPFDIPQPPTTDNLVQFGYNFFGNPSVALAAVQNIPVGNDYIIGPGDEIDILMWGTGQHGAQSHRRSQRNDSGD